MTGALLSDADTSRRVGPEGSFGIIYLNLQSRPDRRAAMERQLSELGLVAHRIEACAPENLSTRDVGRFCTPSSAPFVSPPELACTFSHRRAWQSIVDAKVASALVLEDDAVLSRRLPQLLPQLLTLARNWDVLRVEANAALAVTLGPEVDCGLEGVSFRRPLTRQWGAGAYFVSRAGAEKLLGWENLAEPVDTLMMDPASRLFHRLSILQSVPGLCTTPAGPDGDSDLRLARKNKFELMDREYRRRIGDGFVARLRHYSRRSKRLLADLRLTLRRRWAEGVRGAIRMTVPFTDE